MKRIDALKDKLTAAKAELTIRYRQYNAARRGLDRVLNNIIKLEKKIADLENLPKQPAQLQ